MDIQALRMTVTQDDLNRLLARLLPKDVEVENLSIGLTAEGVVVRGKYPALMLSVPFETVWDVTGAGSGVKARLSALRIAGLPAGKMRTVLLKVLRDSAVRARGVSVQEEAVLVDLE